MHVTYAVCAVLANLNIVACVVNRVAVLPAESLLGKALEIVIYPVHNEDIFGSVGYVAATRNIVDTQKALRLARVSDEDDMHIIQLRKVHKHTDKRALSLICIALNQREVECHKVIKDNQIGVVFVDELLERFQNKAEVVGMNIVVHKHKLIQPLRDRLIVVGLDEIFIAPVVKIDFLYPLLARRLSREPLLDILRRHLAGVYRRT